MIRLGLPLLASILVLALYGRDAAAGEAAGHAPVRLVESRPVDLPPRARLEGLHGTVVLEFMVNREGRAKKPQVVESAGHDLLDAAAAYAVTQWRFEPAIRNGRPAEQKVRQQFMILPADDAEKAALRELVAKERKIILAGQASSGARTLERTAEKGTVTLLLTLGSDGLVSWLKIEESSGIPKLDYLAAAAVYDDMAFDLDRWSGRAGRRSRFSEKELEHVGTNTVYRLPIEFQGAP